MGLLGPAFVASAGYVDPGNFATNFTAGAEHGYLLVWVVVLASLMAVLVQYVTSKAIRFRHSLTWTSSAARPRSCAMPPGPETPPR